MAVHPLDRYAWSWALVTGSARLEGLGFAFARKLAARRVNVVLVDILVEELEVRAEELRSSYGVSVRALPADLGDVECIRSVQEVLQDTDVDILICNHMYTPTDTPEILDMPLDVHNHMIDVNARAYVNLIYRFGQLMRDRRRGAIVIVSSGAGLAPAPYTAAYSANKAFQIAFGEALWYELRSSGVDVLVVTAGLMNTQGDALSGYPKWQITDRDEVAGEVLQSIGRKHLVAPCWQTRMTVLLTTRLMSRRRAVTSVGNFMASGLAKDGG
jgi:short-subunit dehydrogenase